MASYISKFFPSKTPSTTTNNTAESTISSIFSPRTTYQNTTSSSDLASKMGFIIMVILAYVILIRICITLLSWIIGGGHSSDIVLVKGMRPAKELITIPQDPKINGAKPIFRSVNKTDGIEFTWSIWINIDGLPPGNGQHKCIFYKGNDNIGPDGINSPNNAPGLYIAPDTNELVVIMNTFNIVEEKMTIQNIPMNKWVLVTIRLEGNKLDVYMNGLVAKTMTLQSVPRQNYGDVFVCANGGFDGYISGLTYTNHAMNITEIQAQLSKGPNTTIDMSNLSSKNTGYLSMKWYQ